MSEPSKTPQQPSVAESLTPQTRTLDLLAEDIGNDVIESGQPQQNVIDFTGGDFRDGSQPAQSGPQISRYREFPQVAQRQGEPQTAVDAEYEAAERELIAERVLMKRAEKVSMDISTQFINKHRTDFVPNPTNASLLAETLRTHGMPMTVENLDAALEACRFALDSRPASQFTAAELEAADQILWPLPPREMVEASTPHAPQSRQGSAHPPCVQCGQPYEAHTNGECPSAVRAQQPSSQPAAPQVRPVSTGLPDRPTPIVPQPDTSDPALTARFATMPLEEARTEMLRLMRARALAANDPGALAEESALQQQRRYFPSRF